MPTITQLPASQAFTIKGNTADDQAVAGVIELQVKAILSAGDDELIFARTAATAESINQQGDYGTAIYRIAVKVYAQTNYDYDNGTKKQRTQLLTTTVHMDQTLTNNVWFENLDVSRFPKEGPNEQARLLSEWVASGVKNMMLSKEAVFIRGMVDYTIAMTYKRPQNIKKQMIPTNSEEARKVYNNVNDTVISWRKNFTKTAFGIGKNTVNTIISLDMYNGLATTLPNFLINVETFKIYGSGKLFTDSILGTPTRQHNMLNNSFKAGSDSMINADVSFDFTDVQIIVYGADTWAMPQGMTESRFLEDNNTLVPKWIWKELLGLPENIRAAYTAIFVSKDITDADVKKAQAQKWDATKTNLEQSFQLADFDSDFGTAPTVNSDGTITMADGTIVKNSAYVGTPKASTSAKANANA